MTNSFWREAMDHIPGLVLLFRLDADEQAQLVFASSPVRGELGFTPEEFVLASETEGTSVQQDIQQMIDDIAEKSRAEGATSTLSCHFRAKLANGRTFEAQYRIFRTKSGPHPFILVRLDPATKQPDSHKAGENNAHATAEFFASESPLMKALLTRMEMAASRPGHLLFRGEPGTGRGTLARKVFDSAKLSGAVGLSWEKPLPDKMHDDSIAQTLHPHSAGSGAQSVVLLIEEIDRTTPELQQHLLSWVRGRDEMQHTTRVLATSTQPLEELLPKGMFDAETYYYLAFETLLVPPLSQRKEDVAWMVQEWLRRAGQLPGSIPAQLDDSVSEQLMSYNWPGNLPEFYQALHRLYAHLYDQSGRVERSFEWPETTNDNKHIDTSSAAGSDRKQSDSGSGTVASAVGTIGPLAEAADALFPQGRIQSFDDMNRMYLKAVLQRTSGKIYGDDGAASLLGMKPTTLQSKLKKLGVR